MRPHVVFQGVLSHTLDDLTFPVQTYAIGPAVAGLEFQRIWRDVVEKEFALLLLPVH
jgi:hypothetical protein